MSKIAGELNAEMMNGRETIETLRQQLAEKDAEIARRVTLDEMNAEIESATKAVADFYETQLAEKDAEIERLNRAMRQQAEAVTATINRHHEQMAGKDAEIERLKSENRDACVGLNDYFGQQLAASHAREQQLREALIGLYRLDDIEHQRYSDELLAALEDVKIYLQDTQAQRYIYDRVIKAIGSVKGTSK